MGEVPYEEGDWVYVKLKPFRQTTLAQRLNEKLALRFYGPYKVIQRIGAVAYKLELPTTARIHPVFHVSVLKRALGNHPKSQNIPLLYLLIWSYWLNQNQ